MGNVFYCIPEIYMQGARCCTGNQQCRCVRYTLCLQGGRSTRVRDSKTCCSGVFKEVGAGGDEEGGRGVTGILGCNIVCCGRSGGRIVMLQR